MRTKVFRFVVKTGHWELILRRLNRSAKSRSGSEGRKVRRPTKGRVAAAVNGCDYTSLKAAVAISFVTAFLQQLRLTHLLKQHLEQGCVKYG